MYERAVYESIVVRQACISTVLLTGVLSDLRSQKVRNSMILAGCAMGILLAVQAARPPDVIGIALLQRLPEMLARGTYTWGMHFIWTLAVLYIFFAAGALGAGDVKLCGVIAGMMHFREIGYMLTASLLLGSMAGLLYLTDKIKAQLQANKLQIRLFRIRDLFKDRANADIRGRTDGRGNVHFTIFIAAGYMVTLLMGIGT